MKSRSWIRTMAVSALLSPRTVFRKANNSSVSLVATDSSASSMSSIPLKVLATLTRVVQYLDQNHSEEEGLYSKSGVGLERKEVLRLCKSQRLPDLSLYSPHSIASVVKEILSELYEPLVPADISQELLEVVSGGDIDEKAEQTVMEIFKQIPSSTREFLQVLLGHLNNIAANGSSRMGVTNLALHIGIALVRPTEDKTILNAKNMMRRRKSIAEFLIRQAASLPYDCATEMNIPAIPESVSTYVGDSDNKPSKQLHFVQVTWNTGETDFTPEKLEELFGKYGEIENLGINDQGNRAIIAYVSAAGAEKAERASIPFVHVRRRKPRQSEKRREYSSHSPGHSRPSLQADAKSTPETGKANEITEPERKFVHTQILPTSKLEKEVTDPFRKIIDDTIIVEDIEDDQIENAISNRSSAALHLQANADNQIIEKDGGSVEDLKDLPSIEKLPTSDQAMHASIQPSDPGEFSIQNQEAELKETQTSDQANQTGQLQHEVLDVDVSGIKTELVANVSDSPSLVNTQNENHVPMGDPNPEEVSTSGRDQHLSTADKYEGYLVFKPSISTDDLQQTPPLTPSGNEKHVTPSTDVENPASKYKTEMSLSVEGELLEPISQSLEVSMRNMVPTSDSAKISLTDDAAITALQGKLHDMEKVLSTSTAALSSKKVSNEFERAVLQLHKQILDIVADCLVLAGASSGEVSDKSINGTTSSEFLDFLEAQSKTQVKILEVEVRAGQELLRLHKTHYEKERVELEEEITTLRVGRTETERLCAELRTDLRKCRSELACHVANAADIQRQKSALEEKLAASENQLHAKEIELVKLQAGYDKMEHAAAEAQMRAEKYKQGDFDKDISYQIGQTSSPADNDQRPASVRTNEGLPHTTKLFSKLSERPTSKNQLENPVPPTKVLSDTPVISSRSSNVAALEVMKQQMTRDIQEQIGTTRAALREMEICSSSGKTLEEEEEELRQLQQQLAVRSAEMDAAMKESRTKLKELLDPTAAVFNDNDDMESNQEPSIFDSTALVNELIARAEKTTSCNSAQSSQHGPADASYLTIQNPYTGTPQQLAPYHRPAREAQSILYKKWTADRSRKMAELASYRDHQAALNAQQSMQTFQQTLAEFRHQR